MGKKGFTILIITVIYLCAAGAGLAGTVIALVAETVVFAGAVCAVLVIAKKKAAAKDNLAAKSS